MIMHAIINDETFHTCIVVEGRRQSWPYCGQDNARSRMIDDTHYVDEFGIVTLARGSTP